ncbi:MAG: LamG domain-containing protein, partial [Planctomycetes bacterium]|nr:LamG domain-containing protein [Planctomycetota bacterium]
ERQQTKIVVQALRVGEIGIATTPNETYAITGLKIKAASPLEKTMVIELANGGDGYIPPPEMHAWGGYNTWAARSAGLEVLAEPKIAEAAIGLLETVSKKPRRPCSLDLGPASRAIQQMKPVVWWRLNEFSGPIAVDCSGLQNHGRFEGGVAYYLDGPNSKDFCENDLNRAPHFVDGRIGLDLSDLGDTYSISMWVWNGMPNDARNVTGWLFSRDHNHGVSLYGEHLGVSGKGDNPGRLMFQSDKVLIGKTEIPRWSWKHVAIIRNGSGVRVFLDGKKEIDGEAPRSTIQSSYFAGRSDGDSNWEGRLDEIAIFNRALTDTEISELSVK